MRYQIEHFKCYRYSDAVFLEPHTIRMCPRSDWRQSIEEYQLEIQPTPSGCAQNLDAYGNRVQVTWFDGLTKELIVRSRLRVRIENHNPFDFVLPQYATHLPIAYSDDELASLQPFLAGDEVANPGVQRLSAEALEASAHTTLNFSTTLSNLIYERIDYSHRHDGPAYTPQETLDKGVGACRDVAVLFCACARSVGLAARFVTGYHEPEERDPELHAWSEIYLPGGGWRGFDPSNGLAVADKHITLASAPEPEGAATISGTTRRKASHSLETSLLITRL